MLSKSRIEEELKKIGITPPDIIFYEQTDSTNTRAKEYAKQSAEKRPTVFIANSQTAGRGRRGRSFISESGTGIYISFLTYPNERGADATSATACAAVSLAKAVEMLCNCKTQIKWVNDLYLGGKKLAGILTEGEMDEDGKIAYQIVGMGINVYKKAIANEISTIATSLEGELEDAPDRSHLAAFIIKEFLNQSGDCYEEYKSRSFVIGKRVTVIKASESYEATIIDINPDYSLTIERDGKTEKLFTGEISIRI